MTTAGAMEIAPFQDGDRIIDRYEVQRHLGQGGFANTYLVMDSASGDRRAMKITRNATPIARHRVLREAAFLDQCRHPGVVRTFEAGGLPDGRGYMVMDFIAGRSLTDWRRGAKVPIWDALVVAEAVATALGAIHSRSVLHGDVKPANMILPERDGEVQLRAVTLIDFDAMRELHPARASARQSTIGVIKGTVGYMAPEQLAGRPETEATDIYSLGVVLHEMLVGQEPDALQNAGVNVLEEGMPPVFTGPFVLKRLTDEFELETDEDVPQGISDLLRRMLARDPSQRAQSAVAVCNDIRQLLSEVVSELTLGDTIDAILLPRRPGPQVGDCPTTRGAHVTECLW